MKNTDGKILVSKLRKYGKHYVISGNDKYGPYNDI